MRIFLIIYVILFYNVLSQDLLENAPEWIRMREEFDVVASTNTNPKVSKARTLMTKVGKFTKTAANDQSAVITLADQSIGCIKVLQDWDNTQPAERAQAILGLASTLAVFIPGYGVGIATVLQLVSVFLTLGIEQGPTTEEIFAGIVASAFADEEMKTLRDKLNYARDVIENTRSYIDDVDFSENVCINDATRAYFQALVDENGMDFWSSAKNRFDEIFQNEDRVQDMYKLLYGMCEYATQRYIYVNIILGIAKNCDEPNTVTLYNRANDELYDNNAHLKKDMMTYLKKLRKPVKGAMKFVKYLSESATGPMRDEIYKWLDEPLFDDTGITMNNLPLFSFGTEKYSNSKWTDWAMCDQSYYANKFSVWIDESYWDSAGLSQLQMFCNGGSSKTLGTAAWGTKTDVNCGNYKISGLMNCIPNHGDSTWEGKLKNGPAPKVGYTVWQTLGQNGIKFACSDGNSHTFVGEKSEQCGWGPWAYCRSNFMVCGFNVRFAPYEGDDTGISDVALKCCNLANWNDQEIVYFDKYIDKNHFNYDNNHGEKHYFNHKYFTIAICIAVLSMLVYNVVTILKMKSQQSVGFYTKNDEIKV